VFRTVKYIHYTLHYVTTCTVVIDYASRETTVRYDSWDATPSMIGINFDISVEKSAL
jgi:hypothetical protein